MWVRGLKRDDFEETFGKLTSHPMWVRGLKHHPLLNLHNTVRRTPCGCVD